MTLYITSASFEDRCLALVADLAKSVKEERRIIVLDFRGYENVDPYLANRSRLVRAVECMGQQAITVSVSVRAPLEGEARLIGVITELKPARVVVDVSTLPRSYLFTVCRLLCELGLDTTVRYYRPEVYGRQLSRGVRGVHAVPNFEGAAVGSGNTALVVILGFEGYKALYAWEELGASRTIALLGDPPYRGEFLETAKRQNSEFFRRLGDRYERGLLHTFTIDVAHKQLLALYARLKEEDENVEITLCPLGTKPQSVAAFAFAYKHPEVAVAYVSSLMYYTGDYSRGFDPDYVEVTLESLIGRA